MKITQLELILTHSPRKNAPSQVEWFSTFYFKSVCVYMYIYIDIFFCSIKIFASELINLYETIYTLIRHEQFTHEDAMIYDQFCTYVQNFCLSFIKNNFIFMHLQPHSALFKINSWRFKHSLSTIEGAFYFHN